METVEGSDGTQAKAAATQPLTGESWQGLRQ